MGRLLGLAALTALLLAGCGGGDNAQTGGGDTTSTPAPTETGTATPAETATAAPTVEGAPVAEAQGSADGGRFVFRIIELQRSGPTVVMNATVSLAGGSEKEDIQLNSTFSDGIPTDIDSGGQESGDVFDGVALIDPEGRKKYLVARQADGHCICSNDLGAAFVKEDAPVNLEATLAAPPESVTSVNVVVPNVKTFIDVPIS
jgi:hypothetical protein